MASKFILEMRSQFAKGNRNWESVIELNKRILSIDASRSFAYFDIAEAYKELGDTKTALEFVKKAIDINPNDFFTLRLMALIYDQLDDHDKTYKYAKQSLGNLPKNEPQPPIRLYKILRLFRIIPIFKKLSKGLSKDIANWGSWRNNWSEWANKYIYWYENHRPKTQ